MKLRSKSRTRILGITLVEMVVGVGIATAILAAFTTAAVAIQRSFYAMEDYAKGQNDQMRISDYLSLDLRRAFTIDSDLPGQPQPWSSVRITIPNFYASANTPYDPRVNPVTGWPWKKHHHHKHKSIILNQSVEYGPTTQTANTVVYVFNSSTNALTRSVYQGTFGRTTPVDPAKLINSQVIATDVSDFNVGIKDLDETSTTQITFKPRFRSVASAEAISGTTYFQTTLTRNTR